MLDDEIQRAKPLPSPRTSLLGRASVRSLACVAVINFGYCLAAACDYRWVSTLGDPAPATSIHVWALLVAEVLLLSLPGYVASVLLWRSGRARASAGVLLGYLAALGILLRIDATVFTLAGGHLYEGVIFTAVMQFDNEALSLSFGQLARYFAEGFLVIGLQAPTYLGLRWVFLKAWSQVPPAWMRVRSGVAIGSLSVVLLAAWGTSRVGTDRATLLALQRGLPIPLAATGRVEPPETVRQAAGRALRRALSVPVARPAYLEPVELDGPPLRRPNIVIIYTESLRADAFQPEVMPNLHEFGRECTVALNHYCNGTASYNSLFSTTFGLDSLAWNLAKREELRPPPLVALKRLGYKLHLTASCSMAWWDLDERVFPREMFDTYIERRGQRVEDDLALTEDALAVIDSEGEPFFLFVFYHSTHWNYSFPPEFGKFRPYLSDLDFQLRPELVQRREEVRNRYLNAALFVDHCAGHIVRRLRQRGMLDHTVLAFSSDHGESFCEEGVFGHGLGVGRQESHVPFLIHWPGVAARRVSGFTQHADVFPSILAYMGLESPQLAALTGSRDLLEGPGAEHTVIGCPRIDSPVRYILTNGARRMIFSLPEGADEVEVEQYRDASGWVGEPLESEADPAVLGGLEDCFFRWLVSVDVPYIWAREEGDLPD